MNPKPLSLRLFTLVVTQRGEKLWVVTWLLYRMGTTVGICRREGTFLSERPSLENLKMPKGGGKKVNKRARIQPRRWVG